MRKILRLAVLGALIAAVKRYLDTNPEAKRQVKEQAGKAIDQAKHFAEEAGGKIKARTGEGMESADRPLGGADTATTTPTSTGATVTTPDGPTTGTRPGL